MNWLAAFGFLILVSPMAHAACPFDGMYVYELKQDPRFVVTAETLGKISRGLFWANEEFFRQFNRVGCRGAYRTADVTEVATGDQYTYYRTVIDACDGGNAVGVIVPMGRHKAIAEIGDSEISCFP